MAEEIEVMINEQDVNEKIARLGAKISADYAGKTVHLIGVLKGSIFFMCKLAQYITVPVTMDFMCVSSYGKGTVSSGEVKIVKDLDEPIVDRDVILVEDIIDSGNTLSVLRGVLEARNPASFKIVTLLDKPERREKEVKVEYSCFTIPDEFVVGYGLDIAQKYRNLPYIGIVK